MVSTLEKNLLKLGFTPSEHDECVFYYGKTIFIVYTDDTILLGPDQQEIDTLVKKLGKTFKIEDQGELSDYLGIKIERKPDGTLEWTQPTLTQSILKDLKLDGEEIKGRQNKPNVRAVPALTTVPLTDHKDSMDHNQKETGSVTPIHEAYSKGRCGANVCVYQRPIGKAQSSR